MIKLENITSLFNKKIHLLFFLFLTFCTNVEEKSLKPVTVWEFREFVNESNYIISDFDNSNNMTIL